MRTRRPVSERRAFDSDAPFIEVNISIILIKLFNRYTFELFVNWFNEFKDWKFIYYIIYF